MEKNYYITKFSSQTDYNTFKASTAFTKPNVSLIATDDSYDIKFSPIIIPVTNGICIHKDGKFKIVNASDFDAHYSDIIGSGYTIEGISVVPDTHTSDYTYKIMSLRLMSCNSPDTGVTTSGSTMSWGDYNKDLSGLTDYNTFARITNQSGETTVGTTSTVYLPSDYSGFTGVQSVVDSKAKYSTSASSSEYGPSPYADGDEPNPLYGITTVTNGLSDMDGSGNTEIIVANATGQTNWRTASTIKISYGAGYYPAACCCKRYGTTGLPSGSWYLPATGELGYVVARLGTINSILSLINTKDSSLGIASIPDTGFWSSSESSSGVACQVKISNGYVNCNNGKNVSFHVLAFASVSAEPLKF